MELLSPAGDRAALEAAVSGGADAVYLGLTALNARRGAGNFDAPALKSACDFCHERDVLVYVTVNTLVKDAEFGELEKVAQALWRARADGAIVQDLGAARALAQMLPGLPLHASTQMAVNNFQGVDFLRENGFARAVLAREMTYAQIKTCAGRGVALEVFGHGALCVACSGQCLFSSMVGGRSGNRGLCAQPCRLPYRLEGPLCRAAGDLLSPKDLCAIGNLDALKQAGAASIKLEGRLKGPEYVYKVTSLYRLALDGEKVDAALLRQVFNRGYTAGYGPGVDDGEVMSVPDEKHVLADGGNWPAPPERKIALTGELTARVGEPLSLRLTDGRESALALGDAAERARGTCDISRLRAQILKTGGTPYRICDLSIICDPDVFVSAAGLNALRRNALAALGEARARRDAPDAPAPLEPLPPASAPREGKPLLCVEAADARLLEKALSWGADEIVWAPEDVTREGLSRAPGVPFSLKVPPTLTGESLAELNKWALSNGRVEASLLGNPAHLTMRWPGKTRCDGAMNVANSLTARFVDMPYMPSPELTCAEIARLPGEKELLVYGRVTLMILRHCPLNHCLGGGPHAACRRCDGGAHTINEHVLIDRRGARFPLARLRAPGGCLVMVRNSVPLMLLKRVSQLPACARWRVALTDEDEARSRQVVLCHRGALDGLPLQGETWEALCDLPATTGHYFRGVE